MRTPYGSDGDATERMPSSCGASIPWLGGDMEAASAAALSSLLRSAIALVEASWGLLRLDAHGVALALTADGSTLPIEEAGLPLDPAVRVETLTGFDGGPIGTLALVGSRLEGPLTDSEARALTQLGRAAAAVAGQHAAFETLLRRYQDTFWRLPNPTWIYDPASLRFLDVNESAVRFYGYGHDAFLRMTVLDIRPPEERQRMRDAVRAGADLESPSIWRHRLADGRLVDMLTHGRRMRIGDTEVVVAVAIDRSDVAELRHDLSKTQILLDTIIEALPIGLFVKDMQDDGRYLIYNPAVAAVVGRRSEDVVGRTDAAVFGTGQGGTFAIQDLEVMRGGVQHVFEGERFTNRHGELRHLRTIKKPLPTPDGAPPRYLLGIAEDVTETLRSADRIAHLAFYDALTDLPNRLLLRQRLDQALNGGGDPRPLVIAYLDIDSFKTINDAYGHEAGDRLLKQVAQRLSASLQGADVVSRLGGDEFAVVARLDGRTPVAAAGVEAEAEAVALAHRTLACFDTPFDLVDCVAHIDASIGLVLSHPPHRDVGETLMRHADIALYAAKAEGRGVVRVYADSMRQDVETRQMISEDLRRGLAEHQFELDYQPLHDLASGRVNGFEALVRWRHPTRGLISPNDFIPVAEQTGLIVPIGEWVLGEACRQAATWQESIKVAVNLSAVQFRKGGLVATVERIVTRSGLAARRLELEITESVLLTDSGANLRTLHDLRALGIRIAMDDFGTGYSSLGYLRSFPFDKIKMDRSFIADVCESAGSLAIVRAVTSLGASLSITTTAEGVETEEQFKRLKAEGFDEVQGYFVGRPMSPERAAILAHAQDGAFETTAAA